MHRDLVLIALFSLLAKTQCKVCPSMDVRNTVHQLEKLRNCTVILGHLHFVLMHQEGDDSSAFEKYSFPELTEIVDNLIVYKINELLSLEKLFPNLRIIRGRRLFKEFALVVFLAPRLEKIGLTSLRRIGRGAVKVDSCPSVCYVKTVNWAGLGAWALDFPPAEAADCTDQTCDPKCDGFCWSNSTCQKQNFDFCDFFDDDGDCVKKCPSHKVANYEMMKCLTVEECESMLNHSWWVFNGTCIDSCPIFYYEDDGVKGRCRYVGADYVRECEGGNITTLESLEEMQGCTHINGSLDIRIERDYLGRLAEKNLENIVSISGYLKIGRSKAITSLEFLKSLTTIKGEQLDNRKYSLFVYENPNLRKLWNFTDDFKLTISAGTISFHDNPRLCLSEIKKLEDSKGISNKVDMQISIYTNGYKSCNQKEMKVNVSVTNPTNVTISWESHFERSAGWVVSYFVYYMPANGEETVASDSQNDCEGNGWQTVSVLEAEVQLKNLRPYTRYVYYIKSLTILKQVDSTSSYYFMTESMEPSEPRNLTAEAISDSSIVLEWIPPLSPNGRLTHYAIMMFHQKDDLEIIHERNYCEFPHTEEKTESTLSTSSTSSNTTKIENCSCPKTSQSHSPVEMTSCLEGRKLDKCMNNFHESHHAKYFGELSNGTYLNSVLDDLPYQVVPANESWFVFRNLKHFSLYIFYVRACNTKESEVLCSRSVMSSERTKRKDNADVVRDLRVKVERNSAVVKWSQPEDYNSVVVAHQLEYKRTDLENSKPRFECTREFYKSIGGVYTLVELSHGKYAVHVQAISLAGPGVFSEWVEFDIDTETSSSFVIFGPIIAVIVCVGIIAVGYLWYVKKRRETTHLITSINPDYAGPVYLADRWEVDRDDVDILKELGQGTFGMVYEGRIKSIHFPCAIKTIHDTAPMSTRMEFLNEGAVMKSFSDAPHVVKLLGIVSRGQPPLVIMELMERGDLKTYLRRCREPSQNLTTNEMYRMSAEIADGMAYLAAKKFVHRDLAARNCMVGGDRTVKIGDFGMARDIYETDYYRKETAGLLPVRWMSPESLADGVFTSDSDVWSYGVVLWEMATLAEQPYQGYSNEEVFTFVKKKGKLHRPPECPDLLYSVMDSCWKWRPMERPTFADIVDKLVDHVGEAFRLVAFRYSRQGLQLALNAGPRTENPPAMAPEEETEDQGMYYDASEEEVSLYMGESNRPRNRPLTSQRSPLYQSPGSPSSTFLYDSL